MLFENIDSNIYFLKEIGFFLQQEHLQTHIDSVNHSGNSASMCMTNDGCIRALRAKRSAILLSVLETWTISELVKLLLKSLISPGNFQMLAIHLVLKPSSPVENNLLQTWRNTVLSFSYIPLSKSMPLSLHEEVINFSLHSLSLTNPQTLEGYRANLILKK